MKIDYKYQEECDVRMVEPGTVFTNEDDDVFMKTFDEDHTMVSFVNLTTGEYISIFGEARLTVYPKFDASLKLHNNK